MAIIPGDFRHSIVVKTLTSTPDEYGAPVEAYSTLMTIRAGVKFISGNKQIDTNEVFSSQVLQFTTHYRPTITETCRIEHNGKTYQILSIAEIGYKEGLLITAELLNT